MDDVARSVSDDLHLDVSRLLQILLQEHRAVSEGSLRLAGRQLEALLQLLVRAHHTHSLAAASVRSLDDHRVLHAVAELHRVLQLGDGTGGSGNHGDAVLDGDLSCRRLASHHLQVADSGSDEQDPRVFHRLGKVSVLAEETVAGMNRAHSVLLGDVDDGGDVEVGGDRTLVGVQHERLVRLLAMETVSILKRVNTRCLHVELLGGTHNTHSDLTAVRCHHLGDMKSLTKRTLKDSACSAETILKHFLKKLGEAQVGGRRRRLHGRIIGASSALICSHMNDGRAWVGIANKTGERGRIISNTPFMRKAIPQANSI